MKGKQKPTQNRHTHTHGKAQSVDAQGQPRTETIPVVFFLLTVLSALCLFCKRRRFKEALIHFTQWHAKKSSNLCPRSGRCCGTHVVLYDLLDPSHCQDEDERDQCGVATGW